MKEYLYMKIFSQMVLEALFALVQTHGKYSVHPKENGQTSVV